MYKKFFLIDEKCRREWTPSKEVLKKGRGKKVDGYSLTVMSFNILADNFVGLGFGYCPYWAKCWDYRKGLVVQEILEGNCEVVMLQEFEYGTCKHEIGPLLSNAGYEFCYKPRGRIELINEEIMRKRVDGCGIFFKKDKFEFVKDLSFEICKFVSNDFPEKKGEGNREGREGYSRNLFRFERQQKELFSFDHVCCVALLKHKASDKKVMFANTHIYWDPSKAHIKLHQTFSALKRIEYLLEKEMNGQDKLLVFGGDFNRFE